MNHHVNAIAGRLSLRLPQQESLEILAHGGKSWSYLLIPHGAIAENKTLQGLSSVYWFIA